MDIQVKATNPLSTKTGALVIPVLEKNKLPEVSQNVDKHCGGLVTQVLKLNDLGSANGATLVIPFPQNLKADRLILVRASGELINEKQLQTFFLGIKKSLITHSVKDSTLCIENIALIDESKANKQRKLRLATAILADATYQFNAHKSSKPTPYALKKVTFNVTSRSGLAQLQEAAEQGCAVATGMQLCKDLGNQPGNVCTPKYLTSEARKLAKGNPKVTTSALGEKQMKELNMGALLSVSAGSVQEAQLITIDYRGGKKTDKPYVLVGKGITFDTGGISLKPGAAMDEMKYDMCGAASVLGTMKAVIAMKLPINVIGVVTAAENMPSGIATKPGDIVTSMSGKTIEILNTDAEGRLVLCDALTYVEKYKPKAVIDIATLTGACIVALGEHATGLYANSDALAGDLLSAAEKSHDRAWRMPLWDDYTQQLRSNFADLANIGGPKAGSVTAACFLSEFTKKYDWAHLDIAGTAWKSGAAKGASGRPVPLLTEYLLSQS